MLRRPSRKKLKHLCRYITRPAIANERLALNRAGQVVLTLKTPYRDGTTHIVMSPLEFMQRLAALVPRPRLHLIRFHGVLAPNAKLRPDIIPNAPVDSGGKRVIWGGRAEVRCVLYMSAVAAIRCNPVIHAFAQRLKAGRETR